MATAARSVLPPLLPPLLLLLLLSLCFSAGRASAALFGGVRYDDALVVEWPAKFQECMFRRGGVRPSSAAKDEASKPLHYLSIVQSIGADHVSEEYDLATSLMRCYCKRHGCSAVQNVLTTSHVFYPKALHFFSQRWTSILERHWGSGEWLVGADSDAVPVNFTRSLPDFFRAAEAEGAAVVLHARRNYEVAASMVGVKTDSPFATCFVEQLAGMGQEIRTNQDNGDLLTLVLQLAAPDLHAECNPIRDNDYESFTRCFVQVYARFNEATANRYPGGGPGPGGIPLRVFMPMAGVWRSYEGPNPGWGGVGPSPSHDGFFHMVPGDLIVHGFKHMGGLLTSERLYRCSDNDVAAGWPAHLGDPSLWYSQDQALDLAMTCCYWSYPGCGSAENGGGNMCRDQARCATAGGWGGNTSAGLVGCMEHRSAVVVLARRLNRIWNRVWKICYWMFGVSTALLTAVVAYQAWAASEGGRAARGWMQLSMGGGKIAAG
ncbi:hypothetical protein FOA52_008945 [Chlamydomonas sp. UWO 241]|nr:hypothetical protein FOA52_008945 [Chlamydomonas sp. UWO 241]